ncbi:MAG: hypothetical protein ACLQUY_14985 [Ktedonobacterales bacterium]
MTKSAENQIESNVLGVNAPPERREAALSGPSLVRVFRHGWWLVGLVVILVSALSLAQYLRGPRSYQTEQSFYIVVSWAGASTTYDNYQTSVWTETIGHALAEGRLTTVAGGFTPAINAQLAKYGAVSSPRSLSASQLQRYLTWTNSGNIVVLTANWTTPTGSQALLQAATTAVEDGDLTHVTVWRGALPPEMSARIITAAPATSPQLDQSQQTAAEQLMLSRIALGIVAALFLVLVWDWVLRLASRASSAQEPAKAAER